MTTRIINGVKFDYEVTERTEKELLEIAAQDESFDMEDFETPEVKIAVGDVYSEFMSWETYELKNANDAAVDFLEKITEFENDEKRNYKYGDDDLCIMYVIGEKDSEPYTHFESPDVLKTLEIDHSIMDYRENELKKLIGLSWTDTSELENDLICAIGQTDYLNFEAYAKITPEVGANLYVEDEPKHSYYDIDLDYEDGEMTITDVNHYIMF